jgi:hypothetical protein
MTEATAAPNQRSFSLNSREFYEAVTPPPDPWGWGPRLPREPITWEREVIVEPRKGKR